MQEGSLAVVLKNTYTVLDVYQRLSVLKEFYEQAFYGADAGAPTVERFRAFAQGNVHASLHAPHLEPWITHFSATITAGTLYQRINELHEGLKSVPILTLYVPVVLGALEVDALGPRVRSLVGKDLLMDVHLDPALFGGAAFVWNGVYHNYGLTHLIERRRDAFVNLLAQYGRS